MRAEILSIGTEIMFGEITDTNAQYIASQLPQYGIDLLYVTQVGDNPGRLREVLQRAWDRSDYVFTTGGLGPTEDDLTREMIAAMLDEPLAIDEAQAQVLRQWFASRGRPVVERNLKQANLIPSARALPNPRGTAPGWWVERAGGPSGGAHVIAVLPGPPPEMMPMWQEAIAPELERRADAILVARTLKTTGLGESVVDETLSPLLAGTNPSIGIYARRDGVHARIAAKARTRAEAETLIAPVEAEARRLLGRAVWGVDDETLPQAVGRLLREQGRTLATMESATGGAIASAITDVDGSSQYFRGGIVAYDTAVKIAHGVPAEVIAQHGLYSRETAEAMAHAARRALDADLGVGLSGIAGPDALEGQAPGTMHLALTDGTRTEYRVTRFPYQGREAIKRRAVLDTLSLLREWLLG